MSTAAPVWSIMFPYVGVSSRRPSVQVVVVVVTIVACFLSCLVQPGACLPLNNFYPFNVTTDQHTEVKDDGGSPLINLNVSFPYFNSGNNKLYVNNNGIISFKEQLTTYKPTNFNGASYDITTPIIAPYWADIDIENVRTGNFQETVVYRLTNESEILERASQDVRNYFVGRQNFTAELVFIVTWYNVGYYGANAAGKNKRNTFQSVMITDGTESYVIFNYNKIVWTTGSNSGGDTDTGLQGDPAVVGFHSGNGTYFMLPSSGTNDVINIYRRSNLPVPVPGKYIFRVDGAQVNDLSCAASETITIRPSTISMLGAEAIRVSGPCLNPDFSVVARIRETGVEFPCYVTQAGTAVCVPLPLFQTGELTLELNINNEGWRYSASLNSVNVLDSPTVLMRENPNHWLVGKMVRVTWDEEGVALELRQVPAHKPKTLEVLAYSNSTRSFELVGNIKDVEPGKMTRNFKLLTDYSPYSTLVTRLCWEIHSRISVCIWSDVFPVRWKSINSEKSREWCENWLTRERTLPRIAVKAPFCPCVQTIAENDVGHFRRDPSCDIASSSATNCVYNPSAHMCYRRNLKSASDSGVTCCYDRQGELLDIRDSPGAGTHQRYNYRAQEAETIVPFFSYFEEDLLPKLHCCQYSTANCSHFTKLRNATTCAGYSPPSAAQAAGDPHLVTLDGKNYSFNGLGNFYLVRHNLSDLVVQVTAVQATDEHGVPQNASVFSQVAVVMPSVSDVVEIRKNGLGADVLVNNHTIDVSTSQYRNISVILKDDGSYLINVEPVSVSVTVQVTPDLLNIIVLIGEESYKGNIQGLLGNYNKNPDDDFIARDGTRLPSDASMENVHYNFGLTWEVPPEESYLSDLSTLTPADPYYNPVFIGQIPADSLPENAPEICGDNVQCQFDLTVTKKESVALSTKYFTNKFDEMKRDLDQEVIRCPFLEIPENGNRTVSGYTNGSVAEFFCNAGFTMIPNSPTRYCQKDSTWSGPDVMCAINTNEQESDSKVLLLILGVSGAVVLVLVILITVYLYVRRRIRKPVSSPPEDIELRELNSVFQNANFMQSLQALTRDGRYQIPRPQYVDPSIYVEYF